MQGRILLVEDHPVNQQVALEILRKFGVETELAENGNVALTCLEESPYDLVFMDCHMPEMDGYQATALIRQREATSGGKERLPIIALTANAMEGDRAKCLAAGMDDYLAKPFTKKEMQEKLMQWLPCQPSGNNPHSQVTDRSKYEMNPQLSAPPGNVAAIRVEKKVEDTTPPLALETLENLRSIDPDGDFMDRLVTAFLTKSSEDIKLLREALKKQDSEAVYKAAHAFKSSSANLGALPLAELCKKLEMAGRESNLKEAGGLFEAFEAEYARVEIALTELKKAV
jgi:CheY-like chemotaxis protein/HPt (histidine-containing phosphotransfer) domain-containing protein